ncbi:phosphohydrolase [Arthrobacter sp. MYb227]|uniref:HD domain-containing protein n=1 Tax=Arthrobacter sp. MYb227 TaxID=1848601 RepID=UPI000CFC161A|nr:HD domain-containing protein [Arthrobacter sp. MYb227]PQZ92179.1 phosphohydrolase [Arthrobacter sp. MYb227]
MSQQSYLQIAQDIACNAHLGQTDKAGADYILHPERVAATVRGLGGDDCAVAAAWLHDVLEDCDVTAEDLTAAEIPAQVITAVQAVTKRSGEPLDDYCARVAANPTALLVKRGDLADNTDPARTALLPQDVQERLARKYDRVRTLLGLQA